MTEIYPVSLSRHGNKRWKRLSGYQFTVKDMVVPLVVQELPKAAMTLPIAFISNATEFVPVAVLGLVPNKNLFVTPDGRWIGEYVPAAYRGYPFVVANSEDGKQLVCIDESSGVVSDFDGENFFGADEQPTQAIKDVIDFLTQVSQNRMVTEEICAALKKHDLIQPWVINIESVEKTLPLEGLFRIDETALNQLPAEAFEEIRQAGALPLVYSQLLSMQHLHKLGLLAQAHEETVPKVQPPELNLDILGASGGIVTFSGLN